MPNGWRCRVKTARSRPQDAAQSAKLTPRLALLLLHAPAPTTSPSAHYSTANPLAKPAPPAPATAPTSSPPTHRAETVAPSALEPYGGALTGYCIEDERFLQVPSLQPARDGFGATPVATAPQWASGAPARMFARRP